MEKNGKKRRKKTYAKNQFEEFKKKVNELHDGAITPKTIGMENQRQLYYNWVKELSNVKKINGRYVKVTTKNVEGLKEEVKKANG